jgi:zinc transporter, ZIP family
MIIRAFIVDSLQWLQTRRDPRSSDQRDSSHAAASLRCGPAAFGSARTPARNRAPATDRSAYFAHRREVRVEQWLDLVERTPMLAAIVATLASGWLATSAGALPALALPTVTRATSTVLISLAAGVMLGASIFALLLPALDEAGQGDAHPVGAAAAVTAALLTGALALYAANRWLPHEHFVKGREGNDPRPSTLPRAVLLAVAIAIHNFPEGLSVGIGAASGDAGLTGTLIVAMALQNVPEGLVVAVGLRAAGFERVRAFLLASATGLVEVLGGAVGGASLAVSSELLPWALAFAAGAMLYVISDEIIPESHRPGYEDRATASLFAGLALFLMLDAVIQDWAASR